MGWWGRDGSVGKGHRKRVLGKCWGFGKGLGRGAGGGADPTTTITPRQRDGAAGQGPQHGDRIVPRGWEHTEDTEGTGPCGDWCGGRDPPANRDGTLPRLRFISARADPNNYRDTGSAPSRLRPTMPRPEGKPMGAGPEAAGAQPGGCRRVAGHPGSPRSRGAPGRSR